MRSDGSRQARDDDAPLLSHANCTNPDGCRCAYNPILVDAYSEEELAAMKWATPDTLKKIQQARTITAPPPPKPGKQPRPDSAKAQE